MSTSKTSKTPRRYRLLAAISVLFLLIGLGLWFYNDFADWFNRQTQAQIISTYQTTVNELEDTTVSDMIAAARDFNAALPAEGASIDLPTGMEEEYYSLLSTSPGAAMGYIEIPTISVSLPIYHGADAATLQMGAGHIPGSSLPVGGKGAHCAISAHTGMASEKMFDDLDQMQIGDMFYLHVLDLTLAYQVDQILVVEPDDIDPLKIDPDQDYCTLITCTPYGQNTHRLLVRGCRVELPEQSSASTTSTELNDTSNTPIANDFPILPTVVIAIVLCGGIGCIVYFSIKHKHRNKPKQ